MSVSAENQRLAQIVGEAFGAPWGATAYWDDQRAIAVHVLDCPDEPQPGLVSYATIGLSDHPLVDDGRVLDFAVEFVGVGPAGGAFAQVLATAAFRVIRDRWFCFPGRIFPDVLAKSGLPAPLPHAFFVPPFLWDPSLETVELATKTVEWLQLVPISESELQYATAEGSDALADRFEEAEIDITDLTRDPVV